MRGLALYCGLALASAAFFLLLPQADLWFSGLFYDPRAGFTLAEWGPVRFIADTVPWLARGILVFTLAAALWLALIGRPVGPFDRKTLTFIVAVLALGPGLLANTVLKDHWGRARPSQIAAFGGTRQFTAAPLVASQCERNCSFVSGHAALGFSLVGFALLLPRGRWRCRVQAAALAFGALVGLDRVVAGAHFLSDIVYAGLLVYGLSWLLHRLIVERDLLAAPAAVRLYRRGAERGGEAWRVGVRLYRSPLGRAGLWTGAVLIVEMLLIGFFDRPMALLLHADDADVRPFFDAIARLGLALPYFIVFGFAYAALQWGAALPRLRHLAEPMHRAAAVPAFLFVSLAASGGIVDLLKVLCGRARPKLLFAAGTYDFGWFGLQSDFWSFPSGHAATAAALMTALWCLWPRHLLFYIACGAVVAASRIVTGAHYPSDVVMGAFIAVLTTRAVAAAFVDGRFPPVAWRPWRRETLLLDPARKTRHRSLWPAAERNICRSHGSAHRNL